jgi:hypothetical protein
MIEDNTALRAQVRDSYATPESLEVYRTRVDRGLRIWFSWIDPSWVRATIGGRRR